MRFGQSVLKEVHPECADHRPVFKRSEHMSNLIFRIGQHPSFVVRSGHHQLQFRHDNGIPEGIDRLAVSAVGRAPDLQTGNN